MRSFEFHCFDLYIFEAKVSDITMSLCGSLFYRSKVGEVYKPNSDGWSSKYNYVQLYKQTSAMTIILINAQESINR